MMPQFQRKVFEAKQSYFRLPDTHRPAFLEHLRSTDAELASHLESLLTGPKAQQSAFEDSGTFDYVSQAESRDGGDPHTVDYHPIVSRELPESIGRYRIDAKLGEGGMGVVYRGRDADLNRYLAVKVVKQGRQHDADLCRRFLGEAQVMAGL